MGKITSEGFGIFSNGVILLGLLDTELVLYSSTFLTVSYLFLMEVIYARSYSTLSTFDSAVFISSL